jgi:hypothetical protein
MVIKVNAMTNKRTYIFDELFAFFPLNQISIIDYLELRMGEKISQ